MDTLILDIWTKTKNTIVFVTHRIEEAVYLADKVYVMTARPGTNLATYDIDLPRPRSLEITMERTFFDIVADIKKTIINNVNEKKAAGKYKSQEYRCV